MSNSVRHPSWRASTLVAVMLSLSIGWGIRGNFGHEYGAMIPGMLAATAACLLSGRDDWRRRVAYFAFFGAMGWGFGGSMSYMKVVGYTQSGHLPTMLYGFWGLFFGGFLWAALGGAGTAYPALEERGRLTEIFKPILWILAAWAVFYFLWEPVMRSFGFPVNGPERGLFREARQNDPFYWLDADWVPTLFALVAVCVFDLWDRRKDENRATSACAFVGCALAGALAGGLVYWFLKEQGLLDKWWPYLVRIQGDLSINDPGTGKPFDPNNMVRNWPDLFLHLGGRMSWLFGAAGGLAIYFSAFGKWRSGSSLLIHMIAGWFVVFLVFPVLLGLRMTPPRNDNWAGCLGVLLGVYVYMLRRGLAPVVAASLVCGTIGGFGIAFTQTLKMLALAPGNPARLAKLPPDVKDPIIKAWAHWQSANWHSIVIEQGVGLIYGLGVAVAMGILAVRTASLRNEPRVRRWTEYFAAGFVVTVLVYVSMVKNVTEFTQERGVNFPGVTAQVTDAQAYEARHVAESRLPLNNGQKRPEVVSVYQAVPLKMKAPLFAGIELRTRTWFNLSFVFLSLCIAALLAVHARRPLSFVPSSFLGKGQLLYFIFLWTVVIMNYEKALPGFGEQRLATEWVIFMNAVIVTFMLAYFGREQEPYAVPQAVQPEFGIVLRRALAAMLLTMAACALVFTSVTRMVYGNVSTSSEKNREVRFGPQAGWRIKPILRDIEHR